MHTMSRTMQQEQYIVKDVFWHNRKLTLKDDSKDIYYKFADGNPSSSFESYISEHNSSSSECSNITGSLQDIQKLNTAEKQSYNKLNKKNKIDDMFWHNRKLTCIDESKDIYYEFADEKPSSSDDSYIFEPSSSTSECSDSTCGLQDIEELSTAEKLFYNKLNKKNRIDISYRNDCYLESYRLRINARQKKRVAEMNELFRLLDEKLPKQRNSTTAKTKYNSKLKILRRTCQYINDLSEFLSDSKFN
ncbi:uncharacterized protein LOC130635411 [Hydractinia symbiolongicarpus]|uniref:uncharacterized protein LOC130635411 n=1 Tax=Hydractinia symbiolongicarpus TaxID=13093 RepID=UPI00254B81C3|nr:uncharacterized protein LOC130635411 [Hydractinia symbiolongicarpus]